MGDCRTRFAGVALCGFFLVLRLLFCSAGGMAGSPSMSISISIGECPVEFVEACEDSRDCAFCWGCAPSAGDVRGLKYAPGTVKSGTWNRAS